MADESEVPATDLHDATVELGRVAEKVGGAKVMGDALSALIGAEARKTVPPTPTAATKADPKPSELVKPKKPDGALKAILDELAKSKDPALRSYAAARMDGETPETAIVKSHGPAASPPPAPKPPTPPLPSHGPIKPPTPGTGASPPPAPTPSVPASLPPSPPVPPGPPRPPAPTPSPPPPPPGGRGYPVLPPTPRPSTPPIPPGHLPSKPPGGKGPGASALDDLKRAALAAAAALDKIHGKSGSGGGSGGGSPGSGGRKPRTFWGRMKGRFARTKLGRGMRAGRAKGRSLGGLVGGKGGASMGGKAGGVAGLIVAAGMALVQFREKVAAASESALRAAEKYKEVSGGMAGVFGQKEVNDLLRDIKRGESTAGTAKDLMESDSKRKDAEARIETVIENVTNQVLAVLNDVITPPLELIADAIEFIASISGFTPKAVGPSGLAATLPEAEAAAVKMQNAGRNLMDVARAAAAKRAGGVAGPAGAAPPGRGPI